MNIVLTGSRGFVGSRLKLTLEPDHKVFCIDRSKVNIFNFKELAEYILNNVGPDFIVIHTAAMADTKACEENKRKAYKANVLFTQNLAMLCGDFHNTLIFLSTDQVYDYFNETEHYEYNTPHPTNYYGLTKLWAENIVRSLCPKHYILRLTWQFDIETLSLPNKGIVMQLKDAFENGKILALSKKSFRYITYVKGTIVYILHMLETDMAYGIYNVASVTDKNCYDLYKWTIKAIGADPKGVIKLDNKLKPINLTPYPYALEAAGLEILSYEDVFEKLVETTRKENEARNKSRNRD